jgi:hypothetical protein
MNYDRVMILERGSETYEILVCYEVSSWGSSAQLCGPPEHCSAAEPPELCITRAVMEPPPWAAGKYPNDLFVVALTDRERWAFEEELIENVEPPEPDPDDWYDMMRDEGRL